MKWGEMEVEAGDLTIARVVRIVGLSSASAERRLTSLLERGAIWERRYPVRRVLAGGERGR